jgi:hypothetical protein
MLLKKFFAIDNFVKSVSYCERTTSSGKNFGGKTLAAPSLIKEADNIQIKGIIVTIEVIARKIYRNIFFIFKRMDFFVF